MSAQDKARGAVRDVRAGGQTVKDDLTGRIDESQELAMVGQMLADLIQGKPSRSWSS